jgi:DNA-binding NtrC family response regulator
VPFDARVVATSGADLHARVQARRFREDLYYRIAVVRLVVPPLRERAAEIADLARELVLETSQRTHTAVRALSAGALERLRAHPWPGNVRELENALERVLVLARGSGEIAAEELVFLDDSTSGVPERIAREALAHGIDLARFEKALMTVALQESRGNVAAAARAIGLTRRAFELRRGRHEGKDATAHDDDVPPVVDGAGTDEEERT